MIHCIVTNNAYNMKKAMSLIFEVNNTVNIDGETDIPTVYEDEDDIHTDLSLEINNIEHTPCFATVCSYQPIDLRGGLSSLSAVRPLLAKCCTLGLYPVLFIAVFCFVAYMCRLWIKLFCLQMRPGEIVLINSLKLHHSLIS